MLLSAVEARLSLLIKAVCFENIFDVNRQYEICLTWTDSMLLDLDSISWPIYKYYLQFAELRSRLNIRGLEMSTIDSCPICQSVLPFSHENYTTWTNITDKKYSYVMQSSKMSLVGQIFFFSLIDCIRHLRNK